MARRIDTGTWDHPTFRALSSSARVLWLRYMTGPLDVSPETIQRQLGHTPQELERLREEMRAAGVLASDGILDDLGLVRGLYPDRRRAGWSTRWYGVTYARDGRSCRYCGSDQRLSIDHLIPRSRGGSDRADNLVVACMPCNIRKKNRTPEEAGMTLLPVPGVN
jgi:5-methylcytosine-specific restriction endonuclease McrA